MKVIDSETKEVLDAYTQEEIERRKREFIHNCCDFKIKLMIAVIFIEGIQHYLLDKPGSVIQRCSYPFGLVLSTMLIKMLLKKFKWLEDQAAFMLSISVIACLAELTIFLAPDEFKISPV